MKKYVLYKSETYAYESEIRHGICQDNFEECDVVAEFETEAEALEELAKKSSMVYSNYREGEKVNVVEYFVDEEDYVEDDDFYDILSTETIAYAEW